MKTIWESQHGKITHYIRLDANQVVVGSHAGSGHTDNAGVCSHQDFLNGHFHTQIQSYFGDNVLSEVKTAVSAADTYPPFQAKRSKLANAGNWLAQLPINPLLAQLAYHPQTEHGYRHYGNAGGYKTVLHSEHVTLTVERDQGFIVHDEEAGKRPFTLPGHASSVIAWKDHFFLVVSDNYVVITPNGSHLKAPNQPNFHFGTFLRINGVWRHQDVVCFAYRWFQSDQPSGWLRYELGHGITSHAVKE